MTKTPDVKKTKCIDCPSFLILSRSIIDGELIRSCREGLTPDICKRPARLGK